MMASFDGDDHAAVAPVRSSDEERMRGEDGGQDGKHTQRGSKASRGGRAAATFGPASKPVGKRGSMRSALNKLHSFEGSSG